MQDTVVAIQKGGDKLTISHLDPEKYSTQTFSIDPKQVQFNEGHGSLLYITVAPVDCKPALLIQDYLLLFDIQQQLLLCS